MKMMRPLYLVLALMLFMVYGCDPREETKKPKADFNFTPTSDIKTGDIVTFNNLSTDAETYEWDFNDGSPKSVAQHPTHEFKVAGEFEVSLIVQNKNLKDQINKKIIVTEKIIEIDPTVYDLGDIWLQHYYNDFSESGDWFEGNGEDYTLSIANGMYTMVDINDADDHYGYFVAHEDVMLPIGNYDYEARIKNRVDNAAWGSGLIYGGLDFDYNYFKFSIGLYRIGDTGDGDWVEWTETTDGNIQDWNKLTVRKYQNKYYFFMNEVFLYEDDFSDYGDEFGFAFDQNTTVDIDAVGVYIMDLSGKKSASIKQKINTNNKSQPSKIKLAPKDYNPLR